MHSRRHASILENLQKLLKLKLIFNYDLLYSRLAPGKHSIESLESKDRNRTMIIYARAHAPRNAFELSVSALSECVRLGIIDPAKWQLIGVGGYDSNPVCNLGNKGNDSCIKMIQNVPEPEYKKMLLNADLGLALMISPHSSLAPLDFAAAGMVVVTNSFETKTQESFDKISPNFVVAEPSLNGIVDGISRAISISDRNRNSKDKNSNFNWPNSWEDERCYGKPLFDKVKLWFGHDSAFPFED